MRILKEIDASSRQGEGAADAYRKGRSKNDRVTLVQRLAFEGLEPCDGKLSCPVLRGLGVSNGPWLPGLGMGSDFLRWTGHINIKGT
ncbi:hypothetical protein ACFL9U_02510 [Thermodesulfobacteriota bacterium]